MKNFDLSLYLVLDAVVSGSEEALLQTAEIALKNGVTFLQLRGDKNRWTARDWLRVAKALSPMCRAAGVPFVINDRVDIALIARADGVHLGQSDVPPELARKVLGDDKIIGLSTHTLDEVRAEKEKAFVDYFGVGPVFPTTSKKDAAPAIGTAGLKEMLAVAPRPCVAIGGINPSNVAQVRAQNPAGVAVISAICGQKDVAQATRAMVG